MKLTNLKESKKRILFSIPNIGSVRKETMLSAIGILKDRRYKVELIVPTYRPYENNLNRIASSFLDGEYDYWLNLDSDQSPIRNPLDLVELDKDIISCPAPGYINKKKGEYPIRIHAYDYKKDIEEWASHGWDTEKNPSGVEEVDAVSSGCMLIARRVILSMRFPFQRLWNEDGFAVKGVDFMFCKKAKEKGFKVWAHYKYLCRHYHNLELIEVSDAMEAHYKNYE